MEKLAGLLFIGTAQKSLKYHVFCVSMVREHGQENTKDCTRKTQKIAPLSTKDCTPIHKRLHPPLPAMFCVFSVQNTISIASYPLPFSRFRSLYAGIMPAAFQ